MVLAGSLLLALYLLLVMDLTAFHSRALAALWNRAHVALFVLLTIAFDYTLMRRYPRRPWVWALMLGLPLAVFAIATEILQSFTNRQASIEDVLWDCAGIIATIAFISLLRFTLTRLSRCLLLFIIASLLSITVFSPMMLALADWRNQRDFPLLSNMERFSDRYLWSRGDIVDDYAKDGQYALKVTLQKQLYSGVNLRHFPSNWMGKNALHLSIYNPNQTTLPLSLRVQDGIHDAGPQAYSDRFNQDFNAAHGWTDLVIPLTKIERAPRTRSMNITDMTRLRIFARDDHHAESVFYIDAVYLE